MVTLELYKQWRKTLLDLLARTEKAVNTLSLSEKEKFFSQMQQILKDDSFRIQVVGTVKNGKSSFTNALIGEDILPVNDIPCTAVVSEVKYGKEKKAIVHFCSPLPTGLLNEIPEVTKRYIEKYNYGKGTDGKDVQIPPLEVPYDSLNKYVAIPEPSMDILFDKEKFEAYKAKIDKESPYNTAELFFPASILQNGVELVDSPGLNESPLRTKVTLDYLEKADAAIYLLDATHPVTEEDVKVIELTLLKRGFKDLLMVANRIDMVQKRELLRIYIQAKVQEYTTNKEVFAVSAKEACDAMKQNNPDLFQQSGIPQFKEFLINYLTQKKGILKLNKPTSYTLETIKELVDNEIPKRMASLETQSTVLQDRLNQARPELDALISQRDRMKNSLERNIGLAINPLESLVRNFYKELSNDIESWVEKFTPTKGWVVWASKSDIEDVAEEIIKHIEEKTNEKFKFWQKETFEKNFQRQVDSIFGTLENDMGVMAKAIDSIDNILQGLDSDEMPSVNAAERIFGIVGMLCLPMGRAGGEVFAGGFDLSRFMKNFAVDLGVGLGVGLVALWVWPPAGLIAAIIGVFTGLFNGGKHIMDKTKEQVTINIKNVLQENAEQQIKDLVNKARNTFEEIKDAVIKGLDSEIDLVKTRVNEIEKITKEDQESIAQRRKQLDTVKAELNSISKGVNDLLGVLNENLEKKDN